MSHPKTPLVIVGPVQSGKTSELIRELHRHERRGRSVLAIKHAIDQRAHDRDGLIRSRDGTQYPSTVSVDVLDFDSLVGTHEKPIVVAIDEGQFFGDQLVRFVERCIIEGHYVIIAALNADFRLFPFDCIAKVCAFSNVRQLFAICESCENDAVHSQKIGGDLARSIEVDNGEVRYVPKCTACYFSVKPETSVAQ